MKIPIYKNVIAVIGNLFLSECIESKKYIELKCPKMENFNPNELTIRDRATYNETLLIFKH